MVTPRPRPHFKRKRPAASPPASANKETRPGLAQSATSPAKPRSAGLLPAGKLMGSGREDFHNKLNKRKKQLGQRELEVGRKFFP